MRCSVFLSKWVLLLENLIFLVAGTCLLGIAGFLVIKFNDWNLESGLFTVVPFFLLGLAVIVIALSLIGCLGAGLENRFFLIIYFVLVLAVGVAQVAAIVFNIKLRSELSEQLSNAWDGMTSEEHDQIEQQFDCNGESSCESAIYDKIHPYLLWLLVGAFAALVVEVFTILFTCCMIFGIKKPSHIDEYRPIIDRG